MKWKLNSKIAYDLGVHIGDGNMYTYGRSNKITYCGHLGNEKDFYKSFQKYLKDLYGLNPIYIERPSDNTVLLVINSKELLEFKQGLGLPVGPKDNVTIPKQILKSKTYMKSFMRGLGDTDFSLSFKKDRKGIHREPRLEWYTKSRKLSFEVSHTLKQFGFTLTVEGRRDRYHGYLLRMYGNRNLNLWLEEFGFMNSWTLMKIRAWKKLGYYPIRKSYSELKTILS